LALRAVDGTLTAMTNPIALLANQPEPAQLRAGDSWSWQRTFADFQPQNGWALNYTLNCAQGIFPFPAGSCTPSGDGQSWLVSVAASLTQPCPPLPAYTLYALLNNASNGDAETLAIRRVQVLPAIAGATAPVDTRTHNEIVLANIDAALEGNTRPDVIEYTIHGRTLKSYDRLQLEKLRAIYAYRVRRERVLRGEIVDRRIIGVAFTRPGGTF
jgi:hypothetical protein